MLDKSVDECTRETNRSWKLSQVSKFPLKVGSFTSGSFIRFDWLADGAIVDVFVVAGEIYNLKPFIL